MYDRLETNIPKTLMNFSDKLFPVGSPLFPHRDIVFHYLEEYAKDIKHFIKFCTQVVDVRLSQSDVHRWAVHSKYLNTGEEVVAHYDAVVVCSGHHAVPHVPQVPGIQLWNSAYPGSISHSDSYRRSDDFEGKKVVIVGNGPSGHDIACQISARSRQPLLISVRSKAARQFHVMHDQEEIQEIVEFIPPSSAQRAIRLANGRIVADIDRLIFCTGYLYSYPFLESFNPKLITHGFCVHNLYRHIFYIEQPSLAFVALPWKVSPFPLSEAQASIISRIWSGQLHLPSPAAMHQWEDDLVAKVGNGRAFHKMETPEDIRYQNSLCDWLYEANRPLSRMPRRWTQTDTWIRERFPAIKKAFDDKGEARHQVRTAEELGFIHERFVDEHLSKTF